jgi:cytochrome P450
MENDMTTLEVAQSLRFDPLSNEFLRNPAPVLKRLQAESPVFFYEPLKCWVVTKYDDLQTVTRDVATFSSQATGFVRPPADLESLVPYLSVDEIIITLDPPVHPQHRGVIAKGLLSSVIKRAETFVRQRANALIDEFIDAGATNLMEAYAVPLTMSTIVEILGLPTEDQGRYRRWTNDFFFLMTPRVLGSEGADEIRHVDKAELRAKWLSLAEANADFRDYVDYREAHGGDDIISAMLRVTDDDGAPAISKGTVIRHLIGLIGAGHDTTASTIGHLAYYLCSNPDQLELLKADPTLLANTVEEGLRIRGSVHGLFRVTTKDTSLRGVTIPANTLVYLLMSAAGHDEDVFENSLEFDIRRPNAVKHLAFGYGAHSCLGNGLARLQARVATEELFKRIPDLKLSRPDTRTYLPLMTVTGLQNLEVEWDVPR